MESAATCFVRLTLAGMALLLASGFITMMLMNLPGWDANSSGLLPLNQWRSSYEHKTRSRNLQEEVEKNQTQARTVNAKGYPLHDAIIASSTLFPEKVTLSEMDAVIGCFANQTQKFTNTTWQFGDASSQRFNISSLKPDIPKIVTSALQKAKYDRGRIVEYTHDTVSISKNYRAQVRGVTLACYTTGFFGQMIRNIDDDPLGTEGTEVGPAAYAAHILVPLGRETTSPQDANVRAYNVSMVLEADVMELQTSSALYVPRKYCFEMEQEDGDYHGQETEKDDAGGTSNNEENQRHQFQGLMAGGEDMVASFAEPTRYQPVAAGSKTVLLTTHINRVGWYSPQKESSIDQYEDMLRFVEQAYHAPKFELLVLHDTLLQVNCSTGLECMNAALSRAGEYDLPITRDSMTDAVLQLIWLRDRYDDWFLFQKALGDEILEKEETRTSSSSSSSSNGTKSNTTADAATFHTFPIPYIFDKSIASHDKNSPLLPPILANPYFTPKGLLENLGESPVNDYELNELATCARKSDKGGTQIAGAAATKFEDALRRRLNEHVGERKVDVMNWAMYGVFSPLVRLFNEEYLGQNISWVYDDDAPPRMRLGNLTARIPGRTADWILGTPVENSTDMHNLLEAQQKTTTYSHTMAEAVDFSNPCDKAATNAEVYLFVMSMAVAGSGGLHVVVEYVHHFFRWAILYLFGCCCKRIQWEQQGTSPLPLWRRLLPPYDFVLCIIGIVVFFGLYVPLFIQMMTEFEISKFRTSSVDMEFTFGPSQSTALYGHPALVTLVETTTYCEKARPHLLFGLFVAGLLGGMLINLPFAHNTARAFVRWCQRVAGKDDWGAARKSSVWDRELAILLPPEPEKSGVTHPNIKSEEPLANESEKSNTENNHKGDNV